METAGKAKTEILMLLHEKFALPFACIFLGFMAFPLGIRSLSLRQSSGFGMGIFIFLLYYFLLAAGWSAGQAGWLSPAAAMWFPNASMGVMGIWFVYRTMKEASMVPSQAGAFFSNLYQKLEKNRKTPIS